MRSDLQTTRFGLKSKKFHPPPRFTTPNFQQTEKKVEVKAIFVAQMGTPYPVVEPDNKKLTKRPFIFLVRFVEADGHKISQSVHSSREDRSHLNNDSTLRLYSSSSE
ncbi:hypothetical protein CEXT_386791 [Caerostris extrusa]|uniref:Uncharacterized protein n=1 Tax=Caerostris extrusa TaxID=172846 RepID=A0AAV4NKV2_CAEEX|nr:hypothetical protein CEXT_386791 [Caerostris extrusa]